DLNCRLLENLKRANEEGRKPGKDRNLHFPAFLPSSFSSKLVISLLASPISICASGSWFAPWREWREWPCRSSSLQRSGQALYLPRQPLPTRSSTRQRRPPRQPASIKRFCYPYIAACFSSAGARSSWRGRTSAALFTALATRTSARRQLPSAFAPTFGKTM